jgi:hypothetical protein
VLQKIFKNNTYTFSIILLIAVLISLALLNLFNANSMSKRDINLSYESIQSNSMTEAEKDILKISLLESYNKRIDSTVTSMVILPDLPPLPLNISAPKLITASVKPKPVNKPKPTVVEEDDEDEKPASKKPVTTPKVLVASIPSKPFLPTPIERKAKVVSKVGDEDCGLFCRIFSTGKTDEGDGTVNVKLAEINHPKLSQMIKKVSKVGGVPQPLIHDHVRRESSYSCTAKNPVSSATGPLQVIKGSNEAITGEYYSSKQAHVNALKSDCEKALKIGVSHMKQCMHIHPRRLMETDLAYSARIWKNCHVRGHGNAKGGIAGANAHYASKFQ